MVALALLEPVVPAVLLVGATGLGETGATASGITASESFIAFAGCAKQKGIALLKIKTVAHRLAANARSLGAKSTRAHNFSVVTATCALLFCRNSESLLTQWLRRTLLFTFSNLYLGAQEGKPYPRPTHILSINHLRTQNI